MPSENRSVVSRIEPETRDSRVTVNYRPRNVTMNYVSDQELDTIGSATIQNSLHLTFFGAAFGAAVAFGVTLNTVVFTSPNVYAAYWAVFIVSVVGAAYFGVRSWLDWRIAANERKRIREESRGREPES